MNKKQKVIAIKDIFDKVYEDAKCSLDFENPLQLLIATQLAAQCTDARVNIVTQSLFKKYTNVEAFAYANIFELEQDIKSTGFYHNKAKNIIGCCKMLISDFGGVIPDNMEDLLKLPGVGRKTANLMMGDYFGKPAIVVDTHAKRITARIGLTNETHPTKVEKDLLKIVPPEYSSTFCHQLVYHGRAVCKAPKPKCGICPIIHLCDLGVETYGKSN